MEYDVTIDRNLYIGGSDIPVIMGISPFNTRYNLLLEKAGLKENDFSGNKYTEYGKVLEPLIRSYINEMYQTSFIPNQTIKGDLRANTDGFNDERVLEIKTTSDIHSNVDGYKIYLVQLLFYMQTNEVEEGVLAVYERPEDFNTVFNAERLQIHEISIKEYKSLVDEINSEIERFRADLERLKENPLLSEEDFQPKELIALSNKVIALENRMAEYKAIEAECKEMKTALYEAMQKHDVKSWTTPNGIKITKVDEVPQTAKITTEFDLDTFKTDKPDLYKEYCKEVIKKVSGKSGYVKITLPKSEG
jgi:putative phage-type endonuclease